MKYFAAFVVAAALATPALAQTTSAPAQPWSVHTTLIGTILDNPAAKAIFAKNLPDIASADRIDEARQMTLDDIAPYAPDVITPAKLDSIEAEFKTLPPQ